MSKTSSKPIVALSTFKASEVQICTSGANLTEAQDRLSGLIQKAIQQHELIRKGERDCAFRAVFLGLLFWQIKNEAGHGKFMPLAEARFPEIAQRTRNNYMKLALAFVETMKVALPERMDVPDTQLALSLGEDDERAEIVQKAQKFVGEHSLTELLIKYDIKAVGLKKELEDEKQKENADASLPPEEQLRRRRELIFGETSEHLSYVRKTLTDPQQLQILEPSQLDTIEQELGELRNAILNIRKAS